MQGTLLAESLRIGHDVRVPGFTVTRLGRHDVSASATGGQPSVWTFVDFEAPDERVEELSHVLADVLLSDHGWYANFRVGEDCVVVFAGKVFRYRVGDSTGRAEAVAYGIAAGTPRHQLDWSE